MKRVRALADEVVDTSEHTVHSLRKVLLERFSPRGEAAPLHVQVLSFGHKFGTPRDMELMFDVRHLPNPFFVSELGALSASDRQAVKYLKTQPEEERTLKLFFVFSPSLLPQFHREGKSYPTRGVASPAGR